jgi:hypothetical protein
MVEDGTTCMVPLEMNTWCPRVCVGCLFDCFSRQKCTVLNLQSLLRGSPYGRSPLRGLRLGSSTFWISRDQSHGGRQRGSAIHQQSARRGRRSHRAAPSQETPTIQCDGGAGRVAGTTGSSGGRRRAAFWSERIHQRAARRNVGRTQAGEGGAGRQPAWRGGSQLHRQLRAHAGAGAVRMAVAVSRIRTRVASQPSRRATPGAGTTHAATDHIGASLHLVGPESQQRQRRQWRSGTRSRAAAARREQGVRVQARGLQQAGAR